jgi:aryl-alcohol dehydrogenase-like predicted oxidoreductase
MNLRPLGNTDLHVSSLCLGTMQWGWTATEDEAFATMDAFVAAGGNFIDTADVYSRWAKGNPGGVSEQIIGRWMKERGNRDQLVVATKVRGQMWSGPDGEGLSRAHIMRAVEDSLRRLQVDTIDLYQCHYPDTATPIDETLRAFEDLVSAGKVRYIGASNYNTELLQEALDVARAESLPRFVSLQPNYSLVKRAEFEQGPMAVCQAEGLGVIPYSPLAAGFLTGKYRRGQKVESQRLNRVSDYLNDRGYAVLDAMDAIAAGHDVPLASVALAWMLANPLITAPIVGANTPQQLADQLPAVDLKLTDEELDSLNTASAAF